MFRKDNQFAVLLVYRIWGTTIRTFILSDKGVVAYDIHMISSNMALFEHFSMKMLATTQDNGDFMKVLPSSSTKNEFLTESEETIVMPSTFNMCNSQGHVQFLKGG